MSILNDLGWKYKNERYRSLSFRDLPLSKVVLQRGIKGLYLLEFFNTAADHRSVMFQEKYDFKPFDHANRDQNGGLGRFISPCSAAKTQKASDSQRWPSAAKPDLGLDIIVPQILEPFLPARTWLWVDVLR